MSIAPMTVVDDDGSRTVGTVWNAAFQAAFEANINAAVVPGETRPTTTGTITAEPIPTGSGNLVSYHNNATLKTIQGMVAGLPDQLWTHYSIGAGQVDFAHQDAGASAALRLINFVTSGKTSLAPGVGVSVYQYDGTAARWRLVTHEQGAIISAPYVAGNFVASAGTFTVDSGDLSVYSFYLKGKLLSVHVNIGTASLSTGTADPQVKIPGGYTSAVSNFYPCIGRGSDNGTGIFAGMVGLVASSALMSCYTSGAGGGFQAQTNTLAIEFSFIFEVQ